MKFDMVLKQFKLSMLILVLVRFSEAGEATFVLLTVSKNFIVYMFFDVYKLIWFNLGIMIGTTELYILMLV